MLSAFLSCLDILLVLCGVGLWIGLQRMSLEASIHLQLSHNLERSIGSLVDTMFLILVLRACMFAFFLGYILVNIFVNIFILCIFYMYLW